MKKIALLLLLSVNATCFGMLQSIKRLPRVKIRAHNLRIKRFVRKAMPVILIQKGLVHNPIGREQQKEQLEKKLDRLTSQLKVCSSFRKKNYNGGFSMGGSWIFFSGAANETIEHPSMWQPTNEKQVKECCDKCFDEWVKVHKKLDQLVKGMEEDLDRS